MKICIHYYLKYCNTNPQPPGLADFIRGTISLFLYCKKYNYKLYINYDIHPIFKYFNFDNNIYIKDTLSKNVIELLPPLSYDNINLNLLNLFQSNLDNINILTNSFYNEYDKDINESYNYIKEMLLPNFEIKNMFESNLEKMKLVKNEYAVFHLRFHDNSIFNPSYDISEEIKLKIINLINNIKLENKNIVIITNFYNFINYLKTNIDNIFFSDNLPIHLGSLDTSTNMEDKIKGTVCDLQYLINCNKIYAISEYGGTGFSSIISKIYNIEYCNYSHIFNLQ
jgi:hypothetical protein